MRFTFYLVAVLACVAVVNGQASMEDVMQHDEACKWRQTFARRPPETAGRALQLAAVSSGTPRCRCNGGRVSLSPLSRRGPTQLGAVGLPVVVRGS